MAKINENNDRFHWLYQTGFFIVLALPVLVLSPLFYPPDWGKAIIFRSVMAILSFLFIWKLLRDKNGVVLPNLRGNKVIWALAGLFIVFLLASIFSVDPRFSFWGSPYRSGGFVTFAFYFVFAMLAFILFKHKDWEKAWIFSICVGILLSLLAIIQYHGLFNNALGSAGDRPSSTIGNPDVLAVYLMLLFFVALSFVIREKSKHLKIFYAFSLLVFLYVILITGSRAAYLGLAIGLIYFLLFFPKKILALKIVAVAFFIIACGIIFYINTQSQFPKFLENNKLFQSIRPRLSINLLMKDPRFAAWQIDLNILKSKPLLGYGPENFAVGFDKYYDPSIPYLNRDIGWWDKAHNIILDTGAQAGILGIATYLALFIALFWQLNKLKPKSTVMAHSMQTILIGYLVANFFSFDAFPTYLIFFLATGYSLYLTNPNLDNENRPARERIKGKGIIISVLFLILIIFLWRYNLAPLLANTQINIANFLADQKQCDQAFGVMDKILSKHSFLDSYLRMQYVNDIKTCASSNPWEGLNYAEKGQGLLKEAIKIQPLYTRYWISLGNFTTIVAGNEQNIAKKETLIKEANFYLSKAEELSPMRAEIFAEKAKINMVSGDYNAMETDSNKCLALNPGLKNCYWTKALSDIYTKNFDNFKADAKTAQGRGVNINSASSLNDLAAAYLTIQNYPELIKIYQQLVKINPNVPDYHSSLAIVYSKIGEYKKAREQALIFLKLVPEEKDSVNAFLKTLP